MNLGGGQGRSWIYNIFISWENSWEMNYFREIITRYRTKILQENFVGIGTAFTSSLQGTSVRSDVICTYWCVGQANSQRNLFFVRSSTNFVKCSYTAYFPLQDVDSSRDRATVIGFVISTEEPSITSRSVNWGRLNYWDYLVATETSEGRISRTY